MKRYTILIVLMLMTSLLTGCKGAVDVSNKEYIEILGIDINNGIYKLTMKSFQTKGKQDDKKEEEEKMGIIISEGKTLKESIDNAGYNEGKPVFLGHCKLVVIGSSLQDLYNNLYYLKDGITVPISAFLITAVNAGEIVTAPNSNNMNSILKQRRSCGHATDCNIMKLYSTADTHEGVAIPQGFLNEEGNVNFGGTVIYKDGKSVNIMGINETMGISIINNTIENMVFSVQKENKTATIEVDSLITTSKTKVENDKLYIDLKIYCKGRMTENPYKITEAEAETEVRRLMSASVADGISAVKGVMTDCINLEKMTKKYEPEFYEKYKEDKLFDYAIYSIDTEIKVSSQIKM